jgi:acyl carrier protein
MDTTREMTMDTTREAVIQVISHIAKVSPSRILPQTDLRLDLNVDSLQGLQIVAAIEKRFEIEIPDEELDHYTTVDEIVSTIHRLRRPAASR